MGAAGSLPDRQRLPSVTYADDARKLGMEDDRESGPGEWYVLTRVPMDQPTDWHALSLGGGNCS